MSRVSFPEIRLQVNGLEGIRLPRMLKIRQFYDRGGIRDPQARTLEELEEKLSPELKGSLRGKQVCITAGSRGIPGIVPIMKTVVGWLKGYGAAPFLVPAMGSHGGGTAQGQRELLAGYGLTEESLGVPILSSMEVVRLGELRDGTPVFCDKTAYSSDGIIVLNKIKPHTDFRGAHESGLAKMCAVGLSKFEGASAFHAKGFSGFSARIREAAGMLIQSAPVLFGLGVVQNAYGDICEMEAVPRDRILERDAALQKIAKEKIARFKVNHMDVLIIDEIGKDISGNGHDPNITGRSCSPGFEGVLDCKRLFVRGLTEATRGNACGLSRADMTTWRVMNAIDLDETWTNAIAAAVPNDGKLPMYANNDREALLICIRSCGGTGPNGARVVRIRSTSAMEDILVSEAYLDEVKDRGDVKILSGPQEMKFDGEGNFID